MVSCVNNNNNNNNNNNSNVVNVPHASAIYSLECYQHESRHGSMSKCTIIPNVGLRSQVRSHARCLKKIPLNYLSKVSY